MSTSASDQIAKKEVRSLSAPVATPVADDSMQRCCTRADRIVNGYGWCSFHYVPPAVLGRSSRIPGGDDL